MRQLGKEDDMNLGSFTRCFMQNLVRITAMGIFNMLMAFALSAQASEPNYPNKPIRIVVPYAPGGNADFIGREIAHHFSRVLGVPVIVDNRPGAGSLLGVGIVSRATPDGYTLGLTTAAAMAIQPALGMKIPFDPIKSFTPVGLMAYTPFVLAVNAAFPANTVSELIAVAKSEPGKISYGTPGVGTPNHLGFEMLKSMTAINIVHVPYKGSAPALTDLLGGRIQMIFAGVPQVLPYSKPGKLKMIAVGHSSRLKALPDVPTVAETVPGFDNSSWEGLLAPAGTPKGIIAKLNQATNDFFSSPNVIEKLSTIGVVAARSTPAEFKEMIRRDLARWKKVIEVTGVKINP